MCDLCAAQKDVLAINISDNRTALLYELFQAFCTTMQIKHCLDDPALSVSEILQVYGHRVCYGHCSKLPQFRADLVSAAW